MEIISARNSSRVIVRGVFAYLFSNGIYILVIGILGGMIYLGAYTISTLLIGLDSPFLIHPDAFYTIFIQSWMSWALLGIPQVAWLLLLMVCVINPLILESLYDRNRLFSVLLAYTTSFIPFTMSFVLYEWNISGITLAIQYYILASGYWLVYWLFWFSFYDRMRSHKVVETYLF